MYLLLISLFYFFLLEENPKSDDEEDLEIIVVSPLPGNILLTQPPPYLILMVRLFSLLHLPFLQLLLLSYLCHHPKILLRAFPPHLLFSLFILLGIPPQFPFLIPLLTLIPYFPIWLCDQSLSFFVLHPDFIFTQFFVSLSPYL